MTTPILDTIRQRLGQHGACADSARATGIDYSTVVRIKRGEIKSPGIETLEKLANHLGLSLGICAKDTPSVTEINSPEDEAARSNGLGKEIKGA